MTLKKLLVCVGIAVFVLGVFLFARRLAPVRSENFSTVAAPMIAAADNPKVATPAGTPPVAAPVVPESIPVVRPSSAALDDEARLEPDPVREKPFAAFEQWLHRYEQADEATKKTLEAEGKALAQARLTALADLIPTQPKRALELALPFELRAIAPESVRTLLEERINARGGLAVIATFGDAPTELLPAVMRQVTIGGQEYQAFTYGQGLNFITKKDVPLNGIAVPNDVATKPYRTIFGQRSKVIALSHTPVRVLARAEVEVRERDRVAARQPDPLCAISQKPVTWQNEETVIEFAGNIHAFCGKIDASAWAAANIQAAGLETPAPNSAFPTAESSYTEGRKRMFLMRPYWTNQAIAMNTNSAITHFNNFSNYMWQMSYGKLRFAAFGQGSDISTELLIPGDVNSYVAGLGSGAGQAWQAVKDVAQTNYGYDLSKYDFLYYITTDKPAASYCGLGFVGGVGFHLANSCFGPEIAGHEYGHNLGLNHAHFWDTSQASMIGAGQNVEYGDNNDPMGGGGNPNQYNSRYKNYLGWITNTDVVTITGSNRYRLYCFDQDYSVGLRGLRFPSSGTDHDNYWINFRQRKTGSPALMNGAQLLWTGNGNSGSYLLDVRLKGDADNNAVVIGRTFSDPVANFHFTPIGKGNTYPESIDIVAVAGVQTGNLPPLATLAANTLTPGVAQAVTFTATASDPNGDALAYYWEFGDGADSYSSDNKPTQIHSFASAGEYAVRCVVSDMRGGTAQHTLIVRVGSPSVFRISGHVTDSRSQPMAGALVRAGSKSVFVDSDGSYVIPGLNAGSYTVSAIEPLRGAVELVHPFFNNPVNLGPNASQIDFIVGTSAPPVTLVATGAIWKYLDTGTDPGAGWEGSVFNDATWLSGPSQLGYGENDESTRIEDNPTPGYVAADQNRYLAYYFRNYFTVANPAAVTNLVLNVLRDDGVIVYLNGVEIFRDNMPASGVTFTTPASSNVADDGQTWITTNVPTSLLVSGQNVIAAEVHQSGPTSSDVTFNLTLDGDSTASIPRAAIVYIASPADNATFTSPTNIAITANAFSTPASVTNVEIYDGATLLASATAPPYNATLSGPADGLHVLRAVSADSGGIRRTSPPVNITIAAPVAQPVSLAFLSTGSGWRYFSKNFGAPGGWQNVGFDDGTWNTGSARLGFNSGNTGLGTVIDGGPSNARYPAAYFRTPFIVNDPSAVTSLSVTLARDDGAIVYLNGVEILRDNITNGFAPYYSMLASNATDNGNTYFSFTVPPGTLVPGTNIIAAEVHQSSATSSDLIFDLGLSGLASTNRARGCWIASSVVLPGSVTLTAQVVVGGNLSATNVEFYSDDVKIGQDTSSPFSFTWNNPLGGTHSMVAVAYDSAGASITSAPVSISVTAAPVGDALISLGDAWKYQDDGLDLGTTWRAAAYNDNQWMSGPGRLGYGGDGETTTVSYGTNANFKYVTTYFRKKFVISSPASFTGLLLRLIRDDGAIVYINGTEVYRTNLLAGPISYNSLALAAVSGVDETTPIDVALSTAALVAGTNTIAVEMHQDSITSSDLGFDLALIGTHNTNTSDGIYLTTPAKNAHYNMPATVSLAAYASSSGGAISLVEYYDGTTKVGQATASPYSATWGGAAAGTHLLTAVATFGASQRMTSPPVSIVVGTAPAPIAPVFTQFFNYGAAWKYWDNVTAAGSGWQNAGFDDSAWPTGNARFGWGLDGEATLITTGRVTHYFRKSIVVTNGGGLDSFTFNVVRDDGVVVYFNGLEVFRTNMPSGPVISSTLASVAINTPDETIPAVYAISASGLGLVYGTNVVAVELHQNSPTSSDASFDMLLFAEGTTEPRIYLGTPLNNSIQPVGFPIHIEANAQAASGRTLTAVEFFADGTNIGQVATLPYGLSWSGASTGLHTIVARSLDNLGNSLTSAPVQITVGVLPVSLVLVPAGAVWKYLDNGSDQGTNWSQSAFDDSSWEFGPAELGYGENDEATRIEDNSTPGYNGNDQDRYITYYFRHAFVVPPDTVITNLTFHLLRDDGAVVWLNGREMFRSNMPNTTINYLTPASTAVSSTDETTFFTTTMTATNLHSGTNLLAIEIHQQASTSSDVSFNLQLDGNGYIAGSTAQPVLGAAAVADGQIRIVWPASATGFQLYSCPQLGSSPWTLVGGSPVTTNGLNVMTLPATATTMFYRLQK